MSDPKLDVSATKEQAAVQVAEATVRAADEAIALTGRFTLCLAGGSTPKAAYELLAGERYREAVEWDKVHVFFGDERTVGPEHADSNYRMAREALLSHVPVPEGQVHRMKGEGDPHQAAAEYDRLLGEVVPDGFDLLMVGMGDDGHTLSLFPHTDALDAAAGVRCVANEVPKLETWRITITAEFANRSREGLAVVTGANKAEPLAAVLEGRADEREHPIAMLRPSPGSLTFVLDAAAAGMDAVDEEADEIVETDEAAG